MEERDLKRADAERWRYGPRQPSKLGADQRAANPGDLSRGRRRARGLRRRAVAQAFAVQARLCGGDFEKLRRINSSLEPK